MGVRALRDELQEKAKIELNEDPKRVDQDLNYIKEWLSKTPHLNARTDDQFLMAFLRGCKFSLERTKEKLDMYYTLKTLTPELFCNRDALLPEIQHVLSLGIMLPLPKLPDSTGPRLVLLRNGIAHQNNIDPSLTFKVGTMIQNIQMLEDDNCMVAGCELIQDVSDTTLTYMLSQSPSFIKKAMLSFQKGFPIRVKGLHFIHIPPSFETVMKLFRPFMEEKMKRRINVYTDIEEFYKVVPKSILPEEYGGEGGKLDELTAYWKAKVESYRDWFVEDDKYGTDEKKRPGKPKTSESVFGVEGSFRQLSID